MKPLFEKKSEKIALADLPKAEELSKELGKIKYRERYMRTLRSTVFTPSNRSSFGCIGCDNLVTCFANLWKFDDSYFESWRHGCFC